MSDERFDVIVEDAFAALPAWVHDAMENVVVTIEGRHPDDPELLGLHEGHNIMERGEYGIASAGLFALPDVITIYRAAILEHCSTEAEVVEEVHITLVHEIAHHFGLEDDQLDALGWS